MTSKNKYIKTLERFLEIMKSKSKPSFYENEKDQIAEDLISACRKADLYDELQSILEEYNVTPEILRKVLLTGQMFGNQPTLDECIKEWEDRGWNVDELKQFPIIKIWKLNKEQNVVDNIYVYPKKLNSTIDFNADYGTLNLLTKTLKALEVSKDDKN